MSRSLEWEKLSKNEQDIINNYQNEFPIKIGAIASALGVVVKKSTLKAGISGQIQMVDDRPEVKVNRHDSVPRQRFTIAHELAHFLLHRDKLAGDGIVDDVLYRSNLSDDLEAQANKLAADIIMPWHLLKDRISAFGAVKISESHIEIIAHEADVSVAAMKIRLGKY